MNEEPARLIAINPGSRYLGLAVFEGWEVRDWAVKSVGGHTVTGKKKNATKIVNAFIDRYKPNHIALKRIPAFRSSRNLDGVVSALREMCRRNCLNLRTLPLAAVKASLLPQGEGNKTLLMEEVVARYPILFGEQQREREDKNSYYLRMFEAVALGIVCLGEMSQRQRKAVTENAVTPAT